MSLFKLIFNKLTGNHKQQFDFNKALSSLVEATQLLQSINVQAWLTDGTNLGFYREGFFIKHDNDIDLGCKIEDYSSNIDNVFAENGWTLKRTCGTQDCGFEQTWQKNDIRIDIFYFYQERDKLWHGAWQRDKKTKKRNLIKYYYEDFDLIKKNYLGHEFLVPGNQEYYIIQKYGKGWRIPVKEWDWAFGPENSVKTDIWI